MLMKTSKTDSAYLSALRMPLIVMVVISHCVTITTGQTPIDYSSIGGAVFSIAELIFLRFGAIAVAVFSVISGYFLFGKYREGLTASLYARECKKRVWSLLLPYILWNIITWGFLWVKNTAALRLGIAPGFSEIEYSRLLPFSFDAVFLAPLNGPLWYVREVIKLAALAPLIYFFLKYTRGWGLLAWYLLYALVPMPYGLLTGPVTMHFVLGAYLGLHGRSLFEPFAPLCGASRAAVRRIRYARWLTYAIAAIFFWAITLGNTAPSAEYIARLGMPFVVFAIFSLASLAFAHEPTLRASQHFGSATFFIYVTHTLGIITLVRGVLYMTPIVASPWGQLLVCFTLCLSALVYSIVGYRLMYRFAPRLLETLCGGRA